MLLREIIIVYSENHNESDCWQNLGILMLNCIVDTLDTRLLFHEALLPVWKGDLIVVVCSNIYHSVISVLILLWLYCT